MTFYVSGEQRFKDFPVGNIPLYYTQK